jgi:hypothetical protein
LHWRFGLARRSRIVRVIFHQVKFIPTHRKIWHSDSIKMGRIFDQEVSVISRERAVARKEKVVELKERTARHTIDTAKPMAKMINDEQAALNYRE